MIIRLYRDTDEQSWVRCRVLSFLDSSYYNDVKREKERYENPSICLVAEENAMIVGLIDVELDSASLCCAGEERGAIVWHLAVLPEYRRKGIARKLWEAAKQRLLEYGIHYCELWTQEDIPANRFYQHLGFQLETSQCWLRCYVRGKDCRKFLDERFLGEIFGPEELVIDVPLSRKEEFGAVCSRMDEVRLYSIRF